MTVTGPLGKTVDCEYAIWEKRNIGGSGRIDFVGKEMMAVSENASVVENISIIESKRGCKREKMCRKTAIIEMAGAAGITLVPPELLNPNKHYNLWCWRGHKRRHFQRLPKFYHRNRRQCNE